MPLSDIICILIVLNGLNTMTSNESVSAELIPLEAGFDLCIIFAEKNR